MSTDPRFAHDTFLVRQPWTPFVNRYEISASTPSPGGKPEPTALLCFVEQKRLAMRESITFFNDSSRTQELFYL
jgi:hypothetical protein